MQISKLSSKGQITVPKFVREVLQLSTGDQVAFVFEKEQIRVIKLDLEMVKVLRGE